MDDTIQSLKDSIRQEVISYQKNIKNENKFSNNNKYFNQKKQNSKAQISDYFNKIKINSKINLSNNLSLNERNYDNNKEELNSINNENNNEKDKNFIIYETFKNILNKNKNINNNNNIYENNIISQKTETGRFNIISEENNKKNQILDSQYFDNMKYENYIPDIEESDLIPEKEIKNEKINYNHIKLNHNNYHTQKINNNNNIEVNNSFDQTSLINDINQLKNLKIEHSNNYNNNLNSNINTNINTYSISNGFKSSYFPENVTSFSMIKENNQNINLTKISKTKKRNDYYRREYFNLRRKYFNVLNKYEKKKKDSEIFKLKGFYEAHKNDKKYSKIKDLNDKLINQLNENTKIFDNIQQIILEKEKEIEDKNNLILKQKILIERLTQQISMDSINNTERIQQNNLESYDTITNDNNYNNL